MRCIFSEGRDALKEIESGVMPRNSMEVPGPDVYSSERGTPSSEKEFVSALSPWQGGEGGGMTTRE